MTGSKYIAMLTCMILFGVLSISQAAPTSPNHERVSKDTDKDSGLQTKLGRIQELIAQLDAEGETNDQVKVDDILPPHPSQVEGQEKQMRSLGLEDRGKFRKTARGLKARYAHKDAGSSLTSPSSSTGDSIEVLAQALARLQQSQSGDEGSYGEKMGTRYNVQGQQQQQLAPPADGQTEEGRQLQLTIAQALARLQAEEQPEPQQEETPHSPAFKNFREEAIRMIENKLLKDLTVADRLGISVADLVHDFEEQEAREESLQKLENSIASIIGDRDE